MPPAERQSEAELDTQRKRTFFVYPVDFELFHGASACHSADLDPAAIHR